MVRHNFVILRNFDREFVTFCEAPFRRAQVGRGRLGLLGGCLYRGVGCAYVILLLNSFLGNPRGFGLVHVALRAMRLDRGGSTLAGGVRLRGVVFGGCFVVLTPFRGCGGGA